MPFTDSGMIESDLTIAITKANPAVVTTKAAHGLTTGDQVRAFDVVGMTEVNDITFTVSVLTSTTFELDGIDSSAYGTHTVDTGLFRNLTTAATGTDVILGFPFYRALTGTEEIFCATIKEVFQYNPSAVGWDRDYKTAATPTNTTKVGFSADGTAQNPLSTVMAAHAGGTLADGYHMLVSNGVGEVLAYNGTNWVTLTATSVYSNDGASARELICKQVVMFKNALHMIKPKESGSFQLNTVWSSQIGTIDVFDTSATNSQKTVLTETNDRKGTVGPLVWALQMHDTLVIYSTDAIISETLVGGTSPFRHDVLVNGRGAMAPGAILDRGDSHVVIDRQGFYLYYGGRTVDDANGKFAEEVWAEFINDLDMTNVFAMRNEHNQGKEQVRFLFPSLAEGSGNATRAVTWDYGDNSWSIDALGSPRTGVGYWNSSETTTWAAVTGSWAAAVGNQWIDYSPTAGAEAILGGDTTGNVFVVSDTSRDDDGVAINQIHDSKDFTARDFFGKDQQDRFFRVSAVLIDASGGSVSLLYSKDEGLSWTAVATQALTGSFARYKLDFSTTATKIRFRLQNNTINSHYKARFTGIRVMLKERTGVHAA